MTVQWSTTLRTALVTQIETTIGTSAKIKVFNGSAPANCAAADSGTKLVEFDLASDWATEASAVLTFSSTPITATAAAAGTAGYYRIYASDGTTCHEQGTVTASGGGGDVTIDNAVIALGQTVNITGWTKTAPGA